VRTAGPPVELQWTPPSEGSVRIYRLASVPTTPGGTLAAGEVQQWGMPLPSSTPGRLSDPAPSADRVYYVPVTILNDQAIIGRPVPFANLPEVGGLKAEDHGRYVQLRWIWPADRDDISRAQVAWSPVGPPTLNGESPRLGITRGEYNLRGGCRIPDQGIYDGSALHIAVFTGSGVPGHEEWSVAASEGSRTFLAGRPPLEVEYTVRFDPSLPLMRARQVHLRVQTHGEGVLPPLVLIARPGESPPIDARDGVIVLSVPAGASATAVYSASLDSVARPATFRLFPADGHVGEVTVADPPDPKTLKLRR
jgi:hypothetical protein